MKKVCFWAALVLGTLVIGFVDSLTPYEYSLALLYFIPVAIAAVRTSLPVLLGFVGYVAAIWFVADYISKESPMQSYPVPALVVIAAIRFFTLAIVGFSIFKAKKAMQALNESQARVMRFNKELEELVNTRTAKLRETVNELESFSHSLVHDMRAPLRAMHSYAEIMMTEHNTNCNCPPNKEYLRRILSASRRMDDLIMDALDYSKIVSGEIPLEPVDVKRLVLEIVDSYPKLQGHHNEIHVKGEFPYLLANRAALTQCISNLLDNAIKFASPDKKPDVQVWAETRGEIVRIWFEDNGIGISKEHVNLVFKMFEKIDPTYEGTGIGLAIVRKAIERMGGEVGVESQPAHGSRFWFQLPKAQIPT